MHPVPEKETERLEALDLLGLSRIGSAEFDAIVELARSLTGATAAAISIVDRDRQWFKARCGLDLDSTPRDSALCAHTIMRDEPLVIADTMAHPEFGGPAIAKFTGMRTYVGVPLLESPGVAYGALCILDREVREVTEAQIAALQQLALVTVNLLRRSRESYRLTATLELVEEQRRDLKLKQRRFEQTERQAKVGGFEMDLTTGRILWSDEVYRIVGLPVGTAMDRHNILACYAPEERARVEKRLGGALEACTGIDDIFRVITPDGQEKWVHIISEIEVVDGQPRRLFGIIQDISTRHSVEEQLRHAADTDLLTGLPNRSCFSREIAARLAEPERRTGLLLLDLDHFKQINDTLGHGTGDILLTVVSARLAAAAAAVGVACRIGGDEFAVILDDVASAEEMQRIAVRLVAAAGRQVDADGHSLVPRLTVGGALAGPDGRDSETLCQNADFALYHAKETLRGGYVHFRENLRSTMTRRINTIREVGNALSEGRVLAWYQPLVRLDTAEIVGLEALARMRRPDGWIVAAGEFQAAMGDPQVACRLTGQILSSVARDVRGWLDAGIPFQHVGLNVGAPDFLRGDLENRIVDAFGEAGTPLDHIILEVTENVLMDEGEHKVVATIEALRRRGVRIALDDFGTGFASLTHLRSFPVDIIKLDKSFVTDMLTDPSSLAIVELVIDLATKLHMRVVAEGVETDEQSARLLDLGCRLGQGYRYARPASAEATGHLLEFFAQRTGRRARDIRLPLDDMAGTRGFGRRT
ncbi:bifunctional diguanylate cyclase/phosphodiesterase [Methylobrevis pamukkalensis]|nr:EAL domain-containing protein [Methylobrevis pamukkalensis]